MVRAARMRHPGRMPPLPSPVRAALGLAVTMLDEARHLPDKAIELPMRAVSTALKYSLRAQQRYAELAARGDEVIAARQTGDAAPSWAKFDEDGADGADDAPRRPRPSAFDQVDEADEVAEADEADEEPAD
jgi:hypothetical protein